MSRRLKLLTAAVFATSVLAANPASAAFGIPWWFSLAKPAPKKTVIAPASPAAVLAQQIADAVAALPGTPTQAQIQAAINGVLATSAVSPQVKQTALAVLQAAVGPTSPIAQAAAGSATVLATNTGTAVVSTSSPAVQTVITATVKSEIVATLAGISSNLANNSTPNNSDYRTF